MLKNIFQLQKIDGQYDGKIRLENWQQEFMMDLPMDFNIGGEVDVDEIKPYHENACEYLYENDKEILNIIIDAIYNNYSNWQIEYGYADMTAEEREYSMPDIERKEEIMPMLTPKCVIILDVEKGGMAYYGIQFICTWDQEHNLGVMLHKNRVVAIGTDEIAFLSWIAEEDCGNIVID